MLLTRPDILSIRLLLASSEIYDWDDDTGLQGVGGGLAGKLDEGLDAFNDDTFGLAEAEVGE